MLINRQKIIVRTSIIGIVANIALAAFKAAVGLLANSISVTLDAVNNLSDALSSVITIIGAKLSVKPADKKHPLGYGRVEYLSSMIIALIILYAGISAGIESIKKIITPEAPDYSAVSLIIIAVAVVVKIVLGTYVSRVGKKVNSDSLAASGKDALMDSIISASVLVAAVIYLIWGISLEAYLGVVISLFIIKAGFDILRETISQILGERIDSEISQQIKAELCAYDGVNGAYDLILHSYGPDQLI
ncbi:MAG TPA: cation transporter, partial [Ruminococcaceae bacterium]|nr:cation transporter [Oscillospiraceae bacterium]